MAGPQRRGFGSDCRSPPATTELENRALGNTKRPFLSYTFRTIGNAAKGEQGRIADAAEVEGPVAYRSVVLLIHRMPLCY